MILMLLQMFNFMNHRSSIIDFTQFNSALIVAKNKHNDRESNGIGKSTIALAIEFVIYGAVPDTINDVVRHGESKCEVILDFKLGTEKYRFYRSRSIKGKSDLKVYQGVGDDWELISGTRVPEAEQKIAELIKINHKAFCHSIKFAQNDLSGLASAKNSEERKAILKEPLQLSAYSKLESLAKSKLSKTRKEIDRIETSAQMLGDPEAEITAAEAELQFCQGTIKSREATIAKLNVSLDEKRARLSDLKNSLDSNDSELHNKIIQIGKRSKELKSTISAANEKIQHNNKTIAENTSVCSALGDELLQLNSKLEIAQQEVHRDSKIINSDLERVSNDELYGTRLLAQLEIEQSQAKKNLPNGDVCPHCLNTITPEHRKQCEEDANRIITEKSKEITKIKTQLTKCLSKKKKLQTELETARTQERELDRSVHRKESLEQELALRSKHILEAESRLFDANKEMEIANAELTEVSVQLVILKEKTQSSAVPELNKKIFDITDEIRVYERSVDNVRDELANAQKRHGAAQEKIKIAQANLTKLKELKAELSSFKYHQKIEQMGVDALSPRGIPTFIIHTIVDELQAASRNWLNKLRSELDFTFTSDLDMIFTVDGSERKWSLLSGGQKVYIALSLKLGLATVIQHKLGVDIRFLLLDEVDQSFDKAGVEAFADVVKKLQDNFLILAITHNDDLKDKFSHAILVEGDGKNGATSQVVSSW